MTYEPKPNPQVELPYHLRQELERHNQSLDDLSRALQTSSEVCCEWLRTRDKDEKYKQVAISEGSSKAKTTIKIS